MPASRDSRILQAPLAGIEGLEFMLCTVSVINTVNRFMRGRHGLAFFAGGRLHRITNQMHDAGLNHGVAKIVSIASGKPFRRSITAIRISPVPPMRSATSPAGAVSQCSPYVPSACSKHSNMRASMAVMRRSCESCPPWTWSYWITSHWILWRLPKVVTSTRSCSSAPRRFDHRNVQSRPR